MQNFAYFLYNEYGEFVDKVVMPSRNLETVIIKHKGIHYRPLHYSLMDRTAQCVPVRVVELGGDTNEDHEGFEAESEAVVRR